VPVTVFATTLIVKRVALRASDRTLIWIAACVRPREYLRLDLRATPAARRGHCTTSRWWIFLAAVRTERSRHPRARVGRCAEPRRQRHVHPRHSSGARSLGPRQMPPEDSLLSRLSERDRRDSEITSRTLVGFVPFALPVSWRGVREIRNPRSMGSSAPHLRAPRAGTVCTGGSRIPVSWYTRPYLIAIEPFRRILYPALLRRIRRAWLALTEPD